MPLAARISTSFLSFMHISLSLPQLGKNPNQYPAKFILRPTILPGGLCSSCPCRITSCHSVSSSSLSKRFQFPSSPHSPFSHHRFLGLNKPLLFVLSIYTTFSIPLGIPIVSSSSRMSCIRIQACLSNIGKACLNTLGLNRKPRRLEIVCSLPPFEP